MELIPSPFSSLAEEKKRTPELFFSLSQLPEDLQYHVGRFLPRSQQLEGLCIAHQLKSENLHRRHISQPSSLQYPDEKDLKTQEEAQALGPIIQGAAASTKEGYHLIDASTQGKYFQSSSLHSSATKQVQQYKTAHERTLTHLHEYLSETREDAPASEDLLHLNLVEITGIDFSSEARQQRLTTILAQCSHIKELRFQGCILLENLDLRGLSKLLVLSFSQNPNNTEISSTLSRLHPEHFPQSLQELELNFCFLPQDTSFDHLGSLSRFQAARLFYWDGEEPYYFELKAELFSPSLLQLELEHCTFPQNASFHHLENLLYFRGVNLRYWEEGESKGLKFKGSLFPESLQELELTHFTLSENVDFCCLPNLHRLKLHQVDGCRLRSDILSPSLHQLELSRCTLSEDVDFCNLPSLYSLKLNQTYGFQLKIEHCPPSLQRLELKNLALSKDTSFHHLKSLLYLHLNYIHTSYIEIASLSDSLEELLFDGPALTGKLDFERLTHLRVLVIKTHKDLTPHQIQTAALPLSLEEFSVNSSA